MCIITEYELEFNAEENYYECINLGETPTCPQCEEDLAYRDSCLRIWRKHYGETFFILIRRLKCNNPDCLCGLHRELPDVLTPYKHYGTEVIEDVVDDVVSVDGGLDNDEIIMDYPCEKTMNHWKAWVQRNKNDIDGHLKAISYERLGFAESLMESHISLLDELRKFGAGWLSTVLTFIYNSGNWLSP